MWLLSFIPDSIIALLVHSIVGLGALLLVVGILLTKASKFHSLLARVVGIVLLVVGVYFEGGLQTEIHWREQVEIQNAEIARLEVASQQVTEKVVTQYIERVKVVKEKQNAIIKEIPKYITKEADANCTIPNSAVVLHDAASKNELPDSTNGIDERASDITLSRLLDTTVTNYGTFHEVREQLKALQDWVREQKKLNP